MHRRTNSGGTPTDSTGRGQTWRGSTSVCSGWILGTSSKPERGDWGRASCWAQNQQCLPGGRSSTGAVRAPCSPRPGGLAGSAGNYAQKSQSKEGLFCGSYGSYLQQQRPRAMQSRGWRASDHVGDSSQAEGKWEAEDKAPPVRAGVLSGQLFSNRWIHTGEKQVKHGVAFNQKHCAHLLSFEKPNRSIFMSHFRLSKPTQQDHLPQQECSEENAATQLCVDLLEEFGWTTNLNLLKTFSKTAKNIDFIS